MTPRRVVVMGGTFDPVHIGHLCLARLAASVLGAERAVLIAEHGHQHRAAPLASLDDRRRLIRAAVGDDPVLREATQLGHGGDLADTVAQLTAAGRSEVHVVFGTDSARHLHRWDGGARLQPAHLWAVPRNGDDGDGISGIGLLALHVPTVSATQVRFAVAAGRSTAGLIPDACRTDIERIYARPTIDAAELVTCASA